MELKEGMYVRILWGNGEQTISKCTNKVDIGSTQYSKNDFYIHTDRKGEVIYKNMIIKARYKPIELIEVGDYVNGKEIEQIINNELYFETSDMSSKISFKEKDIKSIVTKEQFESMQYRIGD